MLQIEEGLDPGSIQQVRELFLEYAEWLGFELCFEGFNEELATLPGRYAPPDGRLLLAREDGEVVGCIALRRLDEASCEMKRLYVRPSHRGRALGRRLAQCLISEARQIGYKKMLLHTLPVMQAARGLYASLGFRPSEPSVHNPIEGALHMELDLQKIDPVQGI